MRHRVHGYKLGRDTEHRKAMFRNLAAGLFEHGQIETTLAKAKAVQPFAEKLVTLARRGDLHARRRAIALLRDRIMCDNEEKITRNKFGDVVKGPKLIRHLFEEIGPRYAERNGGYTRIIKLAKHRIGDASDLVLLQLVGDEWGPEIGGQPSRRKQQASKRRERAAKLGFGTTAVDDDNKKQKKAKKEEAVVADAEVEAVAEVEADTTTEKENEEKKAEE